jgi:hypothetical protein
MIKEAAARQGRKAVLWGRKKTLGVPRCNGVTEEGKGCPFPQETNDEGYYTGACANRWHQEQVRMSGDFE